MAQRLHGLEFVEPQRGVPKYKTGKGLRHLLKGVSHSGGVVTNQRRSLTIRSKPGTGGARFDVLSKTFYCIPEIW